jgi:TonB family protein
MADAVSTLLEHRGDTVGRRPIRAAVVLAASFHLLVLGAAIVLPRLLRPPVEPPQYVAVQIVPAARLGVERPRPAPRPEPKKPEPVPEVPKPEAPKPAVEAPVLPDPKRKPEPEPARPAPEPSNEPPAPEPETQGRPEAGPGGFALGAAVAGFDNPNFTYGYYVDQMLAKISDNWTRPPVGSGVEAVLHFVIRRDGRITQLRVVNSSGLDSFDLAAMRAVQTSSPLPPLPRAFREETLGVTLIVR